MSLKLLSFESLGVVFYSPSIVTMARSCIIIEIKRDSGEKFQFFLPPLHSAPPLGGSPLEYSHTMWCAKLEWWGYLMVKKSFSICTITLAE